MKIYFQRLGYVCQEHSTRYASGSLHVLSLRAVLTSVLYLIQRHPHSIRMCLTVPKKTKVFNSVKFKNTKVTYFNDCL